MNQPSPSAAPAAAPTPTGPFKLPPLGYAYEALEPHIDAQTMNIHHTKHHQAYVNAANGFAEKWPQLGKQSLEETLANLSKVPDDIRTGVRNQVGGHWNHTFFWDLMTPGGAKEPTGDVKSAIEQFGGLSGLIEKVNAAGAGRFGSGWAWLVINKSKKLEILSTANQDSPIIEGNKTVLGVDVWEHAYYLKYQNRRPDYLKAWWNTVNWDKVTANLKKASA